MAMDLEIALLDPESNLFFWHFLGKLLSENIGKALQKELVDQKRVRQRLKEKLDEWSEELELHSSNFQDLGVEQRVMVLTKLCSEKLDDKFGEHWRESLKANKYQNVDQTRIKSLGKDDKGNTYWRFTDDCWIFKEGPRKSRPKPINGCKPYLSHVTNQSASTSTSRQHSKSDLKSKRNSDEDWEVVCTTFEEFEDWMNQLKKCRSREQKVLFQFLKETLLPELKAQEESSKRRSERNKFVASVVPKRSSRIQDAITRKEEEKEKR